MWVYEEEVAIPARLAALRRLRGRHAAASSRRSSTQYHENVKYLPGIALPTNVVANPSLQDAVKDSVHPRSSTCPTSSSATCASS